jgi:hypothetical protein
LTKIRHPPLRLLLQLVCFSVEYAVLNVLAFHVQAFAMIIWQSFCFLFT